MTTITKHAKCTRWAVLALAILLCAGLLAGCRRQEQGDPTGTNPPDSTGGTTDTGDSLYDEDGYLKDSLDPNLHFGNVDFQILGWNTGYDCDFFAELDIGDTVVDAVYFRNEKVMDRLGVNMKTRFIDGDNSAQEAFVTTALNAIMTSGDCEFDMIGCYSMCGGTLAVRGVIQDLATLKHLDLEKPWWSESLISMSRLNDKLYFVTGDAANSFLYNMYFLSGTSKN